MKTGFENPFRPGAGHLPPYLAGRETEKQEFTKQFQQDVILQNIVLTGLRGVGKTVLLETVKPTALQAGWAWAGVDLSEATSVNEENLAIRLLTDLSVVTSSIVVRTERGIGLGPSGALIEHRLDYEALLLIFEQTPGLISDKIKAVLETAWQYFAPAGKRGIVFAYDEAQNLADQPSKGVHSLSLLLDVFQSLQRKNIRFMLVLTGLPTLFPKLVAARTFAERMFHVITLDRLDPQATADAITKPITDSACPVTFDDQSIQTIYRLSRGYPYFIQYICREVFDVWTLNFASGSEPEPIHIESIIRKLDQDFFAGRWSRATDRQRDLLSVIARIEHSDGEFTVQEVVEGSHKYLERGFTPSHVNQMLATLCDAGLVYKNRWSKYSLAVPLLDEFIKRQIAESEDPRPNWRQRAMF